VGVKNEKSTTSDVAIWLRGMDIKNTTFDSTVWYVVPIFQRTILPSPSKHKRAENVSFQNVGTHVTEHDVIIYK
jgi:hypothetical protein